MLEELNNRTLFVLFSNSEATPSLWPPKLDQVKSAGSLVRGDRCWRRNRQGALYLVGFSEATPSPWLPELDYVKSAGSRFRATGVGGRKQQDALCPVFPSETTPSPGCRSWIIGKAQAAWLETTYITMPPSTFNT